MASFAERIVRSRWYVPFVLALWIFVPEIRRIVDWRSSFHALSVMSAFPLASLVPGLVAAPKIWPKLGPSFRRVATLWFLGFGYAFAIGLVAHSYLPALYDLVLFALPIFFGVIYGARGSEDVRDAYSRLADATLLLVGLSALYGIYQYAAPPPWDAYWAQQENIESSQGATTAFNFRIFGTLNSTGPFADALMVALVLNLPRLSLRRWYVAVAFVPLTLALALTSVRACWVGLLVGIVAYFLVTPRRKKAALSLAAVAVVLAGAVLAATATVKESSIALTSLTDRLTTFSDLQNDRSASARGAETTTVLAESLDEPLGLGLGSSGTALKLAGQGAVGIDNGYLARFSEMGVVGFALFLAAVLAALVFALRSYSLARSRGDVDGLDLSALAVTFQAVFLAREVFADAHVAFTGMFFWAMVCASSEYGVVPLAAPALAAFDYDGLRRTERTR